MVKCCILKKFFVHLQQVIYNMQELNKLENILSSFLGESKNGMSDLTQLQFNCPACAEDDGVDSDGKYNLEVNIIQGKYRCWKCEHTNGMSGKLSALVKKYGNDTKLSEYRSEINDIKKSKEYELNFIENDLKFEEDEDIIVKLPDKTYDFKFDGNKREENALNYLYDRKITKELIIKHDIKYTDYYCPNRKFANRIIIPSYDKYKNLNYFTGRDYSGKASRKYFNYENSNRKDIIFNEHLINWDGDIVIVEGPTDHISIPNSIPLLGKAINKDYYLYECLSKKSTQKIIVFLDAEATKDAEEVCKRICNVYTSNRIYLVPSQKLLDIINKKKNLKLKDLDPSKIFELYGKKGISWSIRLAEKYECI